MSQDYASGKYAMIGNSTAMQEVYRQIDVAARNKLNVLITGESGVGKELVARAIHNLSSRKSNPFVALNCSAITDTLFESELFGHERGAFTGAYRNRKGAYEQADRGVLLLDEIGDMALYNQAKVLRVVESGEYTRVGGQIEQKSDVRLISATNKDLLHEIEKGKFRNDLYHRIAVLQIHVPSLRERPDDISGLVHRFTQSYYDGQKTNGIDLDAGPEIEEDSFDKDAMTFLESCQWPGNVRELSNVVQATLAYHSSNSPGSQITVEEILTVKPYLQEGPSHKDHQIQTLKDLRQKQKYETYLLILKTINECHGNKTLAAKKLDMPRQRLQVIIRKYGGAKKTRPAPEGATVAKQNT
ncbi:sigma-54-dependent Fis family transcriptional regulator [Candidatus Woesearchaeota archaeon]|nr:sigma-54-dependent Fis family transcriptional regulator [Candidatus Woesearchaeota archaeon]